MASPPSDLLARLSAIVGEKGLITDRDEATPYLTDWRQTRRGEALCVVRPRSTAEVSAAVRLCAESGVPLTPQSGNTGMALGATPLGDGGGVLLSLGRMNAIRNVERLAMTMEVEAGCVLRTAKDAAEAVDRFLPITITAEGSAQIGGVVSTNAGGVNVLRYGMTRSSVLGLEVVLADGTIVNGLRSLRKDNAGYDWKQLFIGSEGTLGIVTAATLKLSPKPRRVATAFVALDSVESALKLLARAQDDLGDALSIFELINASCLDLVQTHFGLTPPVGPAAWYVLIEAGSALAGLDEALEGLLAEAIEQGEAQDATIAANSAQAEHMWNLRERNTEAEKRSGPSVKHDVSVPIERTADFLAAADAAIAARFPGARPNPFGHLGDGNVHYNVLVNAETDAAAVNSCIHDLAMRFGGSISAEHGVGRYRRAELALRKSPEELALMRRIKAMLDPDGRMNPGAVL
jgi:FAD/FMN-containing dehydrogenase